MKMLKTSPELYSHHLASADDGESTFLARSLAFEIADEDGKTVAPEWMQIFPKGPELATIDGRSFKMSDPQAFVDTQKTAEGQPILVDFDHLSAFDPDENGETKAAGWIEELEVRDGEVWARVVWTVRAAQQIAEREWRFVSPEFYTNKKTGEITRLAAVALVNRPAFKMTALARAGSKPHGETTMFKAIAKALGLSDDATETQILTAIEKSGEDLETAKASANTPSTKNFMPRADYDAVLARAETAEGKVGEAETATRKSEVETMVASAVTAGKITPGTKEHYVNLAMASGDGFEEIKKLCSSMVPVADPSNLDDAKISGGGLTDDEKHMAATLGVSEEDYAKQLAADKG